MKKVSVMEEDWDYLIILDACRYDCFSKIYREYLRGKLKKVISLGSSTVEWCKKSFRRRYNDMVYISANPFINSKVAIGGFDAKKHFYRVIDVWNWGWDEKLGSVHPKEVNRAFQNFKDDYLNFRFIVHYLQPHSPYLNHQQATTGFPRPQIYRGDVLMHTNKGRPLSRAEEILVRQLTNLAKRAGFFGKNPDWKIRELLNLPPASPMDAMRRRVGKNGLRQAYEQNLRLVMKYLVKLMINLSGVIIITADHGERLGEEEGYSHQNGLSDPILLEVPWFEVEKVIETKRQCKDNKETE